MRQVLLAAFILLSFTGCAPLRWFMTGKSAETASPAPTVPHAWIVPGEIHISDGELFYSVWMKDVPATSRVKLTLTGAGAPANPAYEGPGGTRKIGARRIGRDHKPSLDLVSREDGPPVPLAGLAAGAYTFAFSVDGRELARESFSLVEVPSCTGARELQVGPATRVFKPYIHPTGLALWVPWTAADQYKGIRVFWFTPDGRLIPNQPSGNFQQIFPRPLGIDVGRGVDRCQLATTEVVSFRTTYVSGFEVVFVLDDEVILGAASSRVNPEGDRGSFQPVAWGAPSPAARAAVKEHLDRWAADPRGAPQGKGTWREETYCAMAQLPEAVTLVNEVLIARQRSDFIDPLRSRAEDKIASGDAAVREQGHKDLAHYRKAALEKARAEDDKRKQLEELVSQFKPGCLAAILPAELAAALERRNRGSE
jgi:hypothetical protein